MLLVLGDDRLNLRQFPDLMAQRLGVGANERPPALAALVGEAGHDGSAIITGNLGFGVSVLTAAPLFGFRLGRCELGVRVSG